MLRTLEEDHKLYPGIAVEVEGSGNRMQKELTQEVNRVVEMSGGEHRETIQNIMSVKGKLAIFWNSNHFYIQKTDSDKIQLKFYPSGVNQTSSVITSVGEDADTVLLMIISSIPARNTQLLEKLESVMVDSPHRRDFTTSNPIDDPVKKISQEMGGVDPSPTGQDTADLDTDKLEAFADELDEREDEREEESLTHEIVVEHHADDFEEDLDFETRMLQLAQEEDTDDDVARVTNYIHKPASDTVILLIELPENSRGKAVYDVPKSTNYPLVDVLESAALEDSTERISLENIELIQGALIPVVGSDDAWAIETEREVNIDYDAQIEHDNDQSTSKKTWTVSGGRVILFMIIILSTILSFALF